MMEGASPTEKPARRPSARQRRAMSAIARPGTAARRPMTASRRPYSAYTRREGESENMPKYDAPESNREWWRFYVKVRCKSCLQRCERCLQHVNKV